MREEIMFITGSMGRGGAERVISILSKHYIEMGFDVSIVMLLHSISSGYKLDSNINIIDLSNDSRRAVFDIPRLILRVRKEIQCRKPKTVICFMAQNILITGLACIGLKQKLIVSERVDPASVQRNFIFKILLNIIYSTCTKTVFQTIRAKNYFPPKVQNNSVIIQNPISVACIAKTKKDPIIVTAGRLKEQKNHKLLIRAFANIIKRYPEYKLNIYGEGPLQNELELLIQELNLENKVRLMGSSAELHNDISNAEMFVLSSDYEGLSNVLMEALMMGLPTISTDCAGSDEVIRDNFNGILIPVRDQKSLEKAIIKIIENKSFAATISKNARDDALKNFAVDKVIYKWDHEIL